MDEQGGHDLCVGNDAFIFEKFSDIIEDKAIPLNWPEPKYCLKDSSGTGFLGKFPITGGFVPLGAKSEDGRQLAGAGTGIFISDGLTFDDSKKTGNSSSELVMEFMQVRWDGQSLSVTKKDLLDNLLGYKLLGNALSEFLQDGDSFLAPLLTDKGIIVFRFKFDGKEWRALECGNPFVARQKEGWYMNRGESEPSIIKKDGQYLISTRGGDNKVRVYSSNDGLNYELMFAWPNNTIPQSLNMVHNGKIYLLTNPNQDILRNPLMAYPMLENGFGEGILIHDEDGIRDDKGDKIPFVDHAVGVSRFIEGQWRHLILYRVCDLKERTMCDEMAELGKVLHGESGPTKRNKRGGVYLVEIECKEQNYVPFLWD
jgi:hypothetical protein